MLKLIVAHDPNMLIGKDNTLVWNYKKDLEHFKKTTLNSTIVMGQKTFESISILKNRKVIVLTNDSLFSTDESDVAVEHDHRKLLKQYKENTQEDLYVCGGEEIYKLFIPYVEEMIITEIKKTYEGNKFFPKYNADLFEETKSLRRNYDDFRVLYYRRKKINIYYYSITGISIPRFVEKLWNTDNHLITKDIKVDKDFILVTPSIMFGEVPPVVKDFLTYNDNWKFMKGVIGGGNRNFGSNYGKASETIAEGYKVPLIGKFEGNGTASQIEKIQEKLFNK